MVQVSPVFYSTLVRIAGIGAVLAMFLANWSQNNHSSDVWFASVVALMVIGPHALDKISVDGVSSSSRRAIMAVKIAFPVLGSIASLFFVHIV